MLGVLHTASIGRKVLCQVLFTLACVRILGVYGEATSAGPVLPSDLKPDVAYFDAGARGSLTVDPTSGRVTEQRDLLAGASSSSSSSAAARPFLRWQGNCLYQDAPASARGSVYMDGSTCFAKLSGPLCNGTCLKGAYTMVLVAQFGDTSPVAALLSASEPSKKPTKRMVWRTSGVLVRTIPAGGFYVNDFLSISSPEYKATPENNTYTAFAATDLFTLDWRLHALAFKPSAGQRYNATWLRMPALPDQPAKAYSGPAPGVFAPVGTDFVLGCDYMETRPDGNDTAAPPVYRCDPRGTNLRGRVAALLVYGRALSEAQTSRLLDLYRPRWAQPSPPPPLPSRTPVQPERGPLPSGLVPDVAYFDAGDRGSLTVDPVTGRVSEQRDAATSGQRPRPSLSWSGDCRYDAAGGGSVVLDGQTCFAKLDAKGLLCEGWDRLPGGYSMVVVANLGKEQQERAALLSGTASTYYFDGGRKMLVWRLGEFLTRRNANSGYTAPEDDNPDDPSYDYSLPDNQSNATFTFRQVPTQAWTMEVLVARPADDAGVNGTARYLRAGAASAPAVVYSGPAPLITAPSGRDFALGCDYALFTHPKNDSSEYRCEITSYLQGRVAAVLVYSKQLSNTDVTRLLSYYRTARWLTPAAPRSPPPPPPSPPAPPGTGLPAALMPDLAYFDASAATASRLVVSAGAAATPRDGVRALLDVLHPHMQRLDWFGDCRYDAAAGGGSVVLDGSSCYAKLNTDLCGQWKLVLNGQGNFAFSLVAVLHLDATTPAPPPRPPLAPAFDGDAQIGDLDTSGVGIMSYGMEDGSYYYFGNPSMHWTTKSTYMTMDGAQDYNNVDYRTNLPQGVPRGLWSLEAITTFNNGGGSEPGQGQAATYSRGTSAQAAGNITKMLTSEYSFPPPDGTEFRIGCTWRDTDLNYDCKPGSFLRGRLSAVLVYGRALSQKELQALHAYYSQRWTATGGRR